MGLKKILSLLFITISTICAANSDTLFVIKNNEISEQFTLIEEVDSLTFSKSKEKYQLNLFKKATKLKTIALSEVDSIVFYNPFIGTFVDERDEQKYRWVRIGDQVWMAQNLAWLPSVNPLDDASEVKAKYYVDDYNGKDVAAAKATEKYDAFGVYYNWLGAMDACPAGWRLPSYDDWGELFGFVGAYLYYSDYYNYSFSGMLKDSMSWAVSGEITNADVFGFSALAAGLLSGEKVEKQDSLGFWWTSNNDGYYASYVYSFYNYYSFLSDTERKVLGASVRCVKGEVEKVPVSGISKLELNVEETIKGATAEVLVELYPENATNKGYTIITSNNSVLSLSRDKVTFKDYGEAKLTVSTNDGEFTNSIDIAVVKPTTGSVTDSRDANVYNWVRLNNQVWLTENMKWLPSVNSLKEKDRKEPTYHVYGYDGNDVAEAKSSSNYNDYGVLYNLSSALGACPEGWHLPTGDEWDALIEYAGGEELASIKLKSVSGWGDKGDGADDFGFAGLPGGYHYSTYFSGKGYLGFWWSSSWRKYDMRVEEEFLWHPIEEFVGYAVRCVQGEVPVEGISLDKEQLTLDIGESQKLYAKFSPLNATKRELTWHSSNTSIIGVDSQGTLYAKKLGSVTVSVKTTDGDFVAECTITVKSEPEGVLIDERDGESYIWVLLGDLRWTTQNMRWLPAAFEVDNTDDESSSEPRYYYYDNDYDNYEEYGVLYNKPAALLACAPGWRLPTQAEWEALKTNYDPEELKSQYGWNEGLGGDNSSGFNALPGGYKNDEATSVGLGVETRWWTDRGTSAYALAAELVYEDDGGIYGYSVRCVSN
ncbi:MAG: hypothetical protein GX801_01580 [Fibrobacter sp.]|nr:hypothetical protein [Fibrobacter sp.]